MNIKFSVIMMTLLSFLTMRTEPNLFIQKNVFMWKWLLTVRFPLTTLSVFFYFLTLLIFEARLLDIAVLLECCRISLALRRGRKMFVSAQQLRHHKHTNETELCQCFRNSSWNTYKGYNMHSHIQPSILVFTQ